MEPIVPVPDTEKITVALPVAKLLSFTSRAWTVTISVLEPSAVIDDVAGPIVECAALATPEIYVTTEDEALTAVPTVVPPNVAVTVPDPTAVDDVKVAV